MEKLLSLDGGRVSYVAPSCSVITVQTKGNLLVATSVTTPGVIENEEDW